ncbi:hypothetical protein SYNTR_1732 [Candidatus Syntrophocurvum alkaliphilum]|uniref:Uncharacterized protein n=1 Tax=Candidatus Syntrophocurvum alkaliphilum TaxID=2293317 RepID=A0A6I6DMS4_9FIRM|nr:hypothetical protein [Candidatus Syntrophocurvum alkaliphilum]QGU00326.1 hypothetical protein SYNTR_1732 [Candidatus Syntrophocurvum alkaliphilum]
MKRLLTVCIVIVLCLGLLTSPVVADDNFTINFDYQDNAIASTNHYMGLLLGDGVISAPLEEEVSYSNSVSGEFVCEQTEQNVIYSGNISITGRFIDYNDYWHGDPSPEPVYRFVGQTEFYFEAIENKYQNNELYRVDIQQFSFSGPMFINQSEFTMGFDDIEVFRDERVEMETNTIMDVRTTPPTYQEGSRFGNPPRYLSDNYTFEYGIDSRSGLTSIFIDTEARDTPGETSVAVSNVIVIGLAGVAAAAAGAAGAASAAGGAGASGNVADRSRREEEEESDSSYKMVLYKDFGNQITSGGETYYVYARMVEVTIDGEEITRPDLTANIDIFSESSQLEMGAPEMSGDYMGASVKAVTADHDLQLDVSKDSVGFLKQTGDTDTVHVFLQEFTDNAVISFRFVGEGGIFQNNVTFELVEPEWDFDAELRFKRDDGIVEFEIEKEQNNSAILTITEAAKEMDENQPYEMAEILVKATSDRGEAIRLLKAIVWQEGLYHVNPEIGQNQDGTYTLKADGEQGEIPVRLQAVVWDEQNNRAVNQPQLLTSENLNIEIQPTDEQTKNAMEVGELAHEIKTSSQSFTEYNFYIKEEIPGGGINLNVPVKLSIKGQDEKDFSEEIVFKVETTDMLPFDREKEIQRCQYVIDNYVPEAHRPKLQDILDRHSQVLGPEGMYELRRKIWNIAQLLVLAEGAEGYKDVERWADRIVNVLEWAEWAGDHCFNSVVKVKLGPAGGVIAPLVRNMMVDCIKAYIYEGLDPISWLERHINNIYNSINPTSIMLSGAETSWKAFCDNLKEREIVITGTGWRVVVPGWLAVKVIVAMRKFITEWAYEGKSLYEAANQTVWNAADDVIGDYLENLVKSKGDYGIFETAKSEINGETDDSVAQQTMKETRDDLSDAYNRSEWSSNDGAENETSISKEITDDKGSLDFSEGSENTKGKENPKQDKSNGIRPQE